MSRRGRASLGGVTPAFGSLSLSSSSSASAVAAARQARAEAARAPTAQSHARRKQDDAILAELERDSAAAEAAAKAAAAAAAAESTSDDHDLAYGRRRHGRRDRGPATNLPREDAHRFRATLEEAIERLELLGLLTSESLRRRHKESTSSSGQPQAGPGGIGGGGGGETARKDIYSLMRHQAELENQFEELMSKRTELRGLSNKSKYLANQQELQSVAQAIKESTAAITANLKDHPTLIGNLNKIQKDRSALQTLMESAVEELKEQSKEAAAHAAAAAAAAAAQAQAEAQAGGNGSSGNGGNEGDSPSAGGASSTSPDGSGSSSSPGGAASSTAASTSIVIPTYTPTYSYDSLVNQVNRWSNESRLLSETKLRQEQTSAALKKLESELEREWSEFERAEDSKSARIIELTQQLKQLKKVTLLSVKYEQQTAVAAKETADRQRAARLADLRDAISRAKGGVKTDKRVHKKSVVFLQRQKEAMDALYEHWEGEYERDHTQISHQLDDITHERQRDQRELLQRQSRWRQDNASKIALMEEATIRTQEEEHYRNLMDRMYLAACLIRFHWKVYWRRRKKELIKLRKKRAARLRAQKKAEKNRPPNFGSSAPAAKKGGEEEVKEGGSATASKPASAKPSGR